MGLFGAEGGGTGENYEKPSEGVQQGVCANVIDLGIVPGFEGKPTHKIDIVFQVQECGKDGKRLQVQQRFSLSMNEKSNLRKFIESWRGRKFEAGEAGKFDIMSMVGANALLTIAYSKPSPKDGKIWANIVSVSALLKNMPEIKVEGYVRREKKAEQKTEAYTVAAGQPF